jgi:hypothetical protein
MGRADRDALIVKQSAFLQHARRGFRVTGVDRTEYLLQRARAHAQKRRRNRMGSKGHAGFRSPGDLDSRLWCTIGTAGDGGASCLIAPRASVQHQLDLRGGNSSRASRRQSGSVTSGLRIHLNNYGYPAAGPCLSPACGVFSGNRSERAKVAGGVDQARRPGDTARTYICAEL